MLHSFDVDIAVEYGVREAILLNFFYFWVEKNKANEKHFINGKYWTYNSVKAFEQLFPYMTKDQIRRTIESLVDKGLILKDCFNQDAHDRTTWFALTDLAETKLGKCQMDLANLPNGNGENHKSSSTKLLTNISRTFSNNSFNNNNIYIVEIEEILNFLNEKTGKHYTARSKASVKMIKERLKEGYTVDEFKSVIQNKTDAWLNNPEMKVYLRPETLFCAKHFESYLNDSHTETPQIDYSEHYYQKPEYVPQTEEEKRRAQEWWDSLEDDGDV